MKALLLAAGLGTRLRPYTDTTPKCLIEINGQPLLDFWLEKLTAAGVGPFLVNTHYLYEQVESHLRNGPFSAAVTLVREDELLGTAGTLIKNIDFFADDDGLLMHADNYCMDDFHGFLQAHKDRPAECEMTMMAFKTKTPKSCGILELDSRGIVIGFHEKSENPPGNLANGAIYLLSSTLLKRFRSDYAHCKDFSTEILPTLLGKIYAYETQAYFVDIGTPDTYQEANIVARKNKNNICRSAS